MKTLSLLQPWASLVAAGAKRIETRSFRTSYRGPLAIHASKGFPRDAKDLCNAAVVRKALGWSFDYQPTLTFGCIVATCRLVQCLQTEVVVEVAKGNGGTFLDFGLNEWIVSEQELAFGNYEPGRWAWLLADIKALPAPVPAKGALGLWEWTPPRAVPESNIKFTNERW